MDALDAEAVQFGDRLAPGFELFALPGPAAQRFLEMLRRVEDDVLSEVDEAGG